MNNNNKNQLINKLVSLVRSGTSIREAAKVLSIPKSTAQNWFTANKDIELEIDNKVEKAKEVLKSKPNVKDLEKELAESQILIDNFFKVKKAIDGAKAEQPEWLLKKPANRDNFIGIPTIIASDWHFGENVDPAQINHVNKFDGEIAKSRAKAFFDNAEYLLTTHTNNQDFPGVVLCIGGDMVSGDIHAELSETNDFTTPEAVLELYRVFCYGIDKLKRFGNVFVPCVTGNHGRMTHKPQSKQRNKKNFDWMLYKFLEKAFEHDKQVKFYIPDSADAYYNIFGHRFCLTHGDQFRGGDSMIGALGPVTRGDHKKRSRNGAVGLSYDTILMGHWHQLIMMDKMIINGSLKGYDEYAYTSNFGFEKPQQALFFTHPNNGITIRMPILLDNYETDKYPKKSEGWISWKS